VRLREIVRVAGGYAQAAYVSARVARKPDPVNRLHQRSVCEEKCAFHAKARVSSADVYSGRQRQPVIRLQRLFGRNLCCAAGDAELVVP